jgi:hypothetical protein
MTVRPRLCIGQGQGGAAEERGTRGVILYFALLPCYTQPTQYLRMHRSFRVLRECVYTVIGCCTSAGQQLCTQLYTPRYYHFGVYKCMYTASRSTMHAMVWYAELPCGGPSTLKTAPSKSTCVSFHEFRPLVI